MKRLLFGLFLAGVSVVGFASTFVFGAALTKNCGVSPAVLSFLRFAVGGAALALLVAGSTRDRARLKTVGRADWRRIAWLGPVGTVLMAWFVFMGCARVSAANASMADALTPIMIFLVALARTRRAEASELLSLACGLAGAVLVIQIVTTDGLALEAYSTGDVFILLSAAAWGVYVVYGRELINRMGSSVFTLLTMATGLLVAAPLLPFLDLAWPQTSRTWFLVVGLGLVSTLMPFWTWNAAQKYLPMSVLGISAYFTPVVAVALAGVFLGESVSPLQWLGTLLVVLSGIIEGLRNRERKIPS